MVVPAEFATLLAGPEAQAILKRIATAHAAIARPRFLVPSEPMNARATMDRVNARWPGAVPFSPLATTRSLYKKVSAIRRAVKRRRKNRR